MTVMGPILINKDVFEPSYNDLKFMVQNHGYFCTNLVILPTFKFVVEIKCDLYKELGILCLAYSSLYLLGTYC